MMTTVNEYFDIQRKNKKRNSVSIELATVIQLTRQGEPIIQFMSESLPSKKTYKRMKHYTPTIGERVMLINDVIIGGWY